jgi:MYXO-CTERM domain-containing protein
MKVRQEIAVRKLILRSVVALAIAAAPAFAVAQQPDSAERQMTRAADGDDSSDWGWMGLLGLVGLLGLKRREREEVVRRDSATAR